MVSNTNLGLERMGRRRFIQTLVGLGVSTGTAQVLTAEEVNNLTTDPKEEIPRLKGFSWEVNTDEEGIPLGAPSSVEPIFYTISRDDWEMVESAHSGMQKVNRQIKQFDTTDLIEASVSSKINGHHSKYAINVRYISVKSEKSNKTIAEPDITIDKLKDKLPETISAAPREFPNKNKKVFDNWSEDIAADISTENVPHRTFPITIEKITDVENECGEKSSGYYFNYKYDPIPGGCRMEADGPRNSGTACMPIWDNDESDWVLLTCAHIINGQNENHSDGIGRSAYQPIKAETFGEVNKISYHHNSDYSYYPMDAATVRPTGNRELTTKLATDDGGYVHTISGGLSDEYIKDMTRPWVSDTMAKRGSRTGVCGGEVTDYIEDEGVLEFQTDATSGGGDSGGPHYDFNNDGDVYVGGVHRAGNPARAVSIESIINELNLNTTLI